MVSVGCIIVHACTVTVMFLSVPGPVSDLTAIPGVVHVDISWSPTLEPNGVISNYEVCYSAVMNCINTSLATQHKLEDLPPNTVVTLSVRAYTIIGPGEAVSRNVSTTHVRKLINLWTCIPSHTTSGRTGKGLVNCMGHAPCANK